MELAKLATYYVIRPNTKAEMTKHELIAQVQIFSHVTTKHKLIAQEQILNKIKPNGYK